MQLAQFNFYGHGKILFNSEYMILAGAKGLVLPSLLGQSMKVEVRRSHSNFIYWRSYNIQGQEWFFAQFEPWNLKLVSEETPEAKFLQSILQEARRLNIHFLREQGDVYVETRLEFPQEWGLGSSSSLIYNVAQWAYVSSLQLHRAVSKGSGFDVVAAGLGHPFSFWLDDGAAQHWETNQGVLSFADKLYFLPLGKKTNSELATKEFRDRLELLDAKQKKSLVSHFDTIHECLLAANNFVELRSLIENHETSLSQFLEIEKVSTRFHNILNLNFTNDEQWKNLWENITMKSLGAWGGDMVLVASELPAEKLSEFFNNYFNLPLIPFKDLVLCSKEIPVIKDEIPLVKTTNYTLPLKKRGESKMISPSFSTGNWQ
jgi:mevalonate kinase